MTANHREPVSPDTPHDTTTIEGVGPIVAGDAARDVAAGLHSQARTMISLDRSNQQDHPMNTILPVGNSAETPAHIGNHLVPDTSLLPGLAGKLHLAGRWRG